MFIIVEFEFYARKVILFQESDVYFMSTTWGRPQGEGSISSGRMWTGEGGSKPDFLVDVISG